MKGRGSAARESSGLGVVLGIRNLNGPVRCPHFDRTPLPLGKSVLHIRGTSLLCARPPIAHESLPLPIDVLECLEACCKCGRELDRRHAALDHQWAAVGARDGERDGPEGCMDVEGEWCQFRVSILSTSLAQDRRKFVGYIRARFERVRTCCSRLGLLFFQLHRWAQTRARC